jgi:hypothetical protein
MEEIEVIISDIEYKKLNKKYNSNNKNENTEKRAIDIVKIFLKKSYPNCFFGPQKTGIDLIFTNNKQEIEIEVKGTNDEKIGWGKLKVSSQNSHDQLRGGMPIYRVYNVFGRKPKIAILRYGIDFDMVVEPRWRITPKIIN